MLTVLNQLVTVSPRKNLTPKTRKIHSKFQISMFIVPPLRTGLPNDVAVTSGDETRDRPSCSAVQGLITKWSDGTESEINGGLKPTSKTPLLGSLSHRGENSSARLAPGGHCPVHGAHVIWSPWKSLTTVQIDGPGGSQSRPQCQRPLHKRF